MSTPAAKRRRIDAASTTLSKPFRSPFKSPLKQPNGTPNTSTLASVTTPTLAEKTPSLTTPRSLRGKKSFTSPVQAAALNVDPDITPLLRKQRELEKQLKEVREALEMAEQARKIERDSKKKGHVVVDAELIELAGKWKVASRQAAEELFGKVRDRVNRMGGPRAWKEMQKKQQEFQGGWDNQDEQPHNQGDNDDNDGDDDDDDDEEKFVEKRDIYAEYDIDLETENEKSQRPKGVGDTGEMPGQEDEFTMAMMLRTLNVDLDTIGYDRETQMWIDC